MDGDAYCFGRLPRDDGIDDDATPRRLSRRNVDQSLAISSRHGPNPPCWREWTMIAANIEINTASR
jgi:hypothetical protein